MNLRFAGQSIIGKVKQRNEDSMYFPSENEQERLLVVADGMGGYNAGDIASQMAVQVAVNLYQQNKTSGKSDENLILRMINEANSAILDYAKGNEFCQGMGTTMIAVLFSEETICVGHVGDSRVYLLHEGTLKQITHDHSFVQSLLDQKRITPEQAKVHPYRNIIMRAVGTEPAIDVDIYREPFAAGDKMLVCSDGLTRYLDDEELKTYMSMNDLELACRQMADEANRRGGGDNITAVMAEKAEGETT